MIPSVVLPHLFLAAAGCAGVEDPDFYPDQSGDDDSKAAVAAMPSVGAYEPDKHGMVQDALVAAGAEFATDNFRAMIINVEGTRASSLVPVINGLLDEGKTVVLDSSGGAEARATIAALTGEIAGIEPTEAALSIVKQGPGAYTVTPLFAGSASFNPDEPRAGNTPLAVLLAADALTPPTLTVAEASAAAAAGTITRSYFQGKGKPVPKVIPSFVDNSSTYVQTGWNSNTDIKRYVFVGGPQYCNPSEGANCTMSFGESIAKAVAHGTSVSVNFSNKLTEALTGGVTLGYSLTLTTTKTSTWTNAQPVRPGWTARPVSYLFRRSGKGPVKNAYVFTSRRKVASACRPSGGCFRYTDTYVRQPNTTIGTWVANVKLNGGSPTSGWNTFQGNADPHSYPMDR